MDDRPTSPEAHTLADRVSDPRKASRGQVYAAIDSERAYQAFRWNAATTTTAGVHENLADWLMYMDDYLAEAKHQLSRNPEPQATAMALDTLRKVVALGVAAMEQCGAPVRKNGQGDTFRAGDAA